MSNIDVFKLLKRFQYCTTYLWSFALHGFGRCLRYFTIILFTLSGKQLLLKYGRTQMTICILLHILDNMVVFPEAGKFFCIRLYIKYIFSTILHQVMFRRNKILIKSIWLFIFVSNVYLLVIFFCSAKIYS